jgi:hypothetical protein
MDAATSAEANSTPSTIRVLNPLGSFSAASASPYTNDSQQPSTVPKVQTSTPAGPIPVSSIDIRCQTLLKYDKFQGMESPLDFHSDVEPGFLHQLRMKAGNAKYFAKLVSRQSIPGYARYNMTVSKVRVEGRVVSTGNTFLIQ